MPSSRSNARFIRAISVIRHVRAQIATAQETGKLTM